MPDATLILHCGAREVTADELKAVPCPPAEGRWRPVPHATVLGYACNALADAGYVIDTMKLGLGRDDARFFGTLTLKSPLASGVQLAVGVRSSLDKSLALQWCCGSRVFVCDNLAFRSSTVVSRKHTTNGVERYAEAICKAVSGLAEYREQEAARIRWMQHKEIDDDYALAFLLRCYQDEGILSPRTLPTALKEWRTPSFEEFDQPTVWRLFNACTYALGPRVKANPQAHAAATIRLSGLLAPPEAPAAQVLHATSA
jgi:Domain of unknown function (DUF932)